MPALEAPLGTYTGWNLRAPQIGASDQLFSMMGSYIPFARTKSERIDHGDPRLSVEERYTSRQQYLDKLNSTAFGLAAEGYLLEQDVPQLIGRGLQQWDSSGGSK
jgi:hypothetical protein